METLLKDIRYSVRSLLKRPAFTAVAIINLAHDIRHDSEIFSVIDALLQRPLHSPEPDRLMTIRHHHSQPDLADIEAQSRAFSTFRGLVLQPLDDTAGGE